MVTVSPTYSSFHMLFHEPNAVIEADEKFVWRWLCATTDDSLLASDTRDTKPEEFVQSLLGDAQNLDPREEAFLGETLLAGQLTSVVTAGSKSFSSRQEAGD
ncbi:hypothetical protein CEP53_012935 [Fusarium sp. AF-6]|nr:hypothetical protein CEP53_012935 [Fusarium sp. AF-6]